VAAETDQGEPPKVIDPGPGCRFRFRCPLAIDICSTTTPELTRVGARAVSETATAETPAGETVAAEPDADREVACHVAQSGAEVKAFS
jgi:hypothetical protein